MHRLVSLRQQGGFHVRALALAMAARLKGHRMQTSLLEKRLKDLNPLSILRRGYSITRKLPENAVLRDVSKIKEGDRVRVSLSEGDMECGVEKILPASSVRV